MGLLDKVEGREKSGQGIGIETDIDKMHDVVMKYGSMAVSEIATILKIDSKRVEELGKILHKHKMAELYYPPIGSPVLRKAGHKSSGRAQNKKLNLIVFGSISFAVLIGLIIILKMYGIL